MSIKQNIALVMEEVASVAEDFNPRPLEEFCRLVMAAPVVYVTGQGRSGFVGRCFAMRLGHLGYTVHFVGETATGHLNAGDALVAISRTGETAVTCLLADAAAAAGGTVVAVTASPKSHLAAGAAISILVPDKAKGASQQFGGSLFEQATLLLLDAVVLELQGRLGQTHAHMEARHTNLE